MKRIHKLVIVSAACLACGILIVATLFSSGKRSKIHQAAFRGDNQVLQVLISTNPTLLETVDGIDAYSPNRMTPLMWAVRGNQIGAVRSLLSAGAKINGRDHLGRSAILIAAIDKNPSMVSLLVDNGALPDSVATNGESPLSIAVKNQDWSTIKLLVEHGANIDHQGESPLAVAIENGSAGCVRELSKSKHFPISAERIGELKQRVKLGDEDNRKQIIDLLDSASS